MQRLSLLDAQFLHVEDERAPMHIGAICIFEGPPPGRAELRAHVQAKLPLIPRYRQRLKLPVLELGRPTWIDDARFELDFHLRRALLPAPGDELALSRFVGELMSEVLDRRRPLWELWTVEGLAGRRWALIVKVHHAMVDGVSGVDLLAALLDPSPEGSPCGAAKLWCPEPEPSQLSLVEDAWHGLAEDAQGWLARLRRSWHTPQLLTRSLLQTGHGLWHWVQHLTPTRKLSIEGAVGAERAYAFHVASLDRLAAVRKLVGATLNDVTLAAIAGGYRRFLEQRGERVDRAELRTLVPVSLRAPDQHNEFNNRVSALLCELPIAEPVPLRRLQLVQQQMQAHKASHMAEAGATLVELGNLAPPMLVGPITRFVARAMRTLPQRAVNTVTTNVPGPRTPLYLLGRRQLAALPYVPIHHGARTGVAVLTYHRSICFGVTADYASTPDAACLAGAIGAELEALASAAQASAPSASPVMAAAM